MKRSGILLCAGLLSLAVTACTHVPTVPASSSDNSPPALKLGTAGLKKDLLLTQDSTAPEKRRAKRSDEIVLLATAEDAESGIRRVTLDMTMQVICGQTATTRNFAETATAPGNGSTLPVRLVKSFVFKPAPGRASCGHDSSRVTFSLRASAENGAGQTIQLQPAIVSSFGPDVLRVATFNLAGIQNHPDSVYQAWGEKLGSQADVWLLTEVIDQYHADLIARAAGLPFVVWMQNGDVAIASRTPLRNVMTRKIEPRGRLTSKNSNVISADTDIDGTAHRFVATHWGIRDDGDVLIGADHSSPSRLRASQAVLDLVGTPPGIAFVGGDMNAYSGAGPQDHDGNGNTPDFVGSTSEVDWLRTVFTDPYRELQVPNDQYCSNSRIDYVFVVGPYRASRHQACFGADPLPSDHPFVMVTFEAGDT